MTSADDKVRNLVTEEAAEWFVANREGLTSKERQAFVTWLRRSPMHVEEYLSYSVISLDLPKACEYSPDAISELVAAARAQPDLLAVSSSARQTGDSQRAGLAVRSRMALIAVACAAAAGIAWVALRAVWPITPTPGPEIISEIHMATHHGEQQSHRLPDGSVVYLNTDSDVTIRYSSKERLVVLNAGEVDFDVVHDLKRAFRVLAGAAQVIDMGTTFDVLLEMDKTVVTVVEGQVAVSASLPGERDEVAVDGNHRVTVFDGIWPPAQPVLVDAKRATAWLHRQIVFDHEPLDKVAEEFNRYAAKPIEIVTPGLRKLEISGAFTIDEPAAFIAFLRSLDNVHVEETGTQIRVSGQPKR